MLDYLRVHVSFEIYKSNAFVDRDVSKQKHSILKIKTIIVPEIIGFIIYGYWLLFQ